MKKYILILLVFFSLGINAQNLVTLINQGAQQGNTYTPSELTLDTSTTTYDTTPALTKPNYLQTVTEPTFGTKITRITGDVGVAVPNITPSENWLDIARHGYNTRQPWNSDESVLYLEKHQTNAPVYGSDLFLNGQTYEVIKSADLPAGNEYRWSNLDPDSFIILRDTEIVSWSYANETETQLASFAGYTGTSMGNTGNLSLDDNFIGMNAVRTSDGLEVAFMVNIGTNTKQIDIELSGMTSLDFASGSPLGNYVFVNGDWGTGSDRTKVFDAVTGVETAYFGDYGNPSHFDATVDQNGDEVLIGVDKTDGRIVKGRMSDGVLTDLTTGGYGTHTSGRGFNRELSVYSSTDVSASYPPYRDEIIISQADGSKVERLAHIRATFVIYHNEAQPVASPSGTRVFFASDWNSGTYPIQGYIIDFRNN